MSKNNITVGGRIQDIKASQAENQPSRVVLEIPVTKHDGTATNTYLRFDTFNNVSNYKVGGAVLVEAVYRQQVANDKNGNRRNYQSLIANSIQYTGTKENPVVFPVNEATIMGNISSDIRKVGQNGGVAYSVALNSFKKVKSGEKPEVLTSYADVVDFTGASNGFTKGQPVYLKGAFRQGSYMTQQGVKVYTMNFVVEKVVYPIPATEVQTQPAEQTQPAQAQAKEPAQQAQPKVQPTQTQPKEPAQQPKPQENPEELIQQSAPQPQQPEVNTSEGFMDLDGLGIDFSEWQ